LSLDLCAFTVVIVNRLPTVHIERLA